MSDDAEARGRPNDADALKRRKVDRHQNKRIKCEQCGEFYSRRWYYEHKLTHGRHKNRNESSGSYVHLSSEDDSDFNLEVPDLKELEDHNLTGHCSDIDLQEVDDSDSDGSWITDDEEDHHVEINEEIEHNQVIAGDMEADDDRDGGDATNYEDRDGGDATNVIKRLLKPHLLLLMELRSRHSLSDTGLLSIWKCVYSLIMNLLGAIGVGNISSIEKALPKSLYGIRKLLCMDRDNFEKYVLCRKCNCRYTMEQATKKLMNGQTVSTRCTYVRHAEHRLGRMQHPCGELLMKTIVSKSGQTFLYPKKTFCYQPLQKGIQHLMNSHQNFIQLTEHWRDSYRDEMDFDNREKVLSDVYDGKIWREFQEFDGKPFLSEPANLALMFNVDWFQPFKHTRYSVGVLYFVIMNLQRHLRFKPQNIILAGIIDGPKEPKININSCLTPVVNDLMDLWDGILIDDASSLLGARLVRAAVLCLAADIPALRKCGGFVGHMAAQGCSKCRLEFPRLQNSTRADYADFESPRPLRDGVEHIHFARRTRNCRTDAERNKLEMQYGARWSEFYNLPYIDPIRMHVIDPMHNLYSGSVAHAIKVWKERDILTDNNMALIQERVDDLRLPAYIGRIPHKIESNFSSLTADQLKTWLHIYSLYALFQVIPNPDLNIWRLFEKACRLISGQRVRVGEVQEANDLFKMYCISFRDRYGRESSTMNHHLHAHLAECILDFGPIYSFWLFSFERYNGIFENFHTNNRDVAVQLFRRFLSMQLVTEQMSNYTLEETFWHGFIPKEQTSCGTLGQIESADWLHLETSAISINYSDVFKFGCETKLNMLENPPIIEDLIFDEHERDIIMDMLSTLDKDLFRISHRYSSYKKCRIGGKLVNIRRHAKDRSCCVAAKWVDLTDGVPTISLSSEIRPGFLIELKKFNIFKPNGVVHEIVVAKVEWMDESDLKHLYGTSCAVTVWSMNNIPENMTAYIPLCRLYKRCAFHETELPHTSRRRARVVITLP